MTTRRPIRWHLARLLDGWAHWLDLSAGASECRREGHRWDSDRPGGGIHVRDLCWRCDATRPPSTATLPAVARVGAVPHNPAPDEDGPSERQVNGFTCDDEIVLTLTAAEAARIATAHADELKAAYARGDATFDGSTR